MFNQDLDFLLGQPEPDDLSPVSVPGSPRDQDQGIISTLDYSPEYAFIDHNAGFFSRLLLALTDDVPDAPKTPGQDQDSHTTGVSDNDTTSATSAYNLFPETLPDFLYSLFSSTPQTSANSEEPVTKPYIADTPTLAETDAIPSRANPAPEPPLEEVEEEIHLADAPPSDSQILTPELAQQLVQHLPPLQRAARTWRCRHALARDGSSLSNLYKNTLDRDEQEDEGYTDHGPCLLVVRDTHGCTFGGLSSHAFRPGGNAFHGNGLSFLFNVAELHPASVGVVVHPASLANTYYILTTPDTLAFGGGDGRFGMYLDGNLESGYAEACATFPGWRYACVHAPAFRVVDLEVWRFEV